MILTVNKKSCKNDSLANSMEQSPREFGSYSTYQEIACLLWNPKFHYYDHKIPPLVPILSQMHPIHTFSLSLSKILSNSILQSTSRSSKWYFPFRISDRNSACISHF